MAMLIHDVKLGETTKNFNSDMNNLQNGYTILNQIENKLKDYLVENCEEDNGGYKRIKDRYRQNDVPEEPHYHFENPDLPNHISYHNENIRSLSHNRDFDDRKSGSANKENRRSKSRLTNKDADDMKFNSRLKGAHKRMLDQDCLQSNHYYSDFMNKLSGDYAVNTNGIHNYRRSSVNQNDQKKMNNLGDLNLQSWQDVECINKLKGLDDKIVKYQQENDDLLRVKGVDKAREFIHRRNSSQRITAYIGCDDKSKNCSVSTNPDRNNDIRNRSLNKFLSKHDVSMQATIGNSLHYSPKKFRNLGDTESAEFYKKQTLHQQPDPQRAGQSPNDVSPDDVNYYGAMGHSRSTFGTYTPNTLNKIPDNQQSINDGRKTTDFFQTEDENFLYNNVSMDHKGIVNNYNIENQQKDDRKLLLSKTKMRGNSFKKSESNIKTSKRKKTDASKIQSNKNIKKLSTNLALGSTKKLASNLSQGGSRLNTKDSPLKRPNMNSKFNFMQGLNSTKAPKKFSKAVTDLNDPKIQKKFNRSAKKTSYLNDDQQDLNTFGSRGMVPLRSDTAMLSNGEESGGREHYIPNGGELDLTNYINQISKDRGRLVDMTTESVTPDNKKQNTSNINNETTKIQEMVSKKSASNANKDLAEKQSEALSRSLMQILKKSNKNTEKNISKKESKALSEALVNALNIKSEKDIEMRETKNKTSLQEDLHYKKQGAKQIGLLPETQRNRLNSVSIGKELMNILKKHSGTNPTSRGSSQQPNGSNLATGKLTASFTKLTRKPTCNQTTLNSKRMPSKNRQRVQSMTNFVSANKKNIGEEDIFSGAINIAGQPNSNIEKAHISAQNTLGEVLVKTAETARGDNSHIQNNLYGFYKHKDDQEEFGHKQQNLLDYPELLNIMSQDILKMFPKKLAERMNPSEVSKTIRDLLYNKDSNSQTIDTLSRLGNFVKEWVKSPNLRSELRKDLGLEIAELLRAYNPNVFLPDHKTIKEAVDTTDAFAKSLIAQGMQQSHPTDPNPPSMLEYKGNNRCKFKPNEYSAEDFSWQREKFFGDNVIRLLPWNLTAKVNPIQIGKTMLNVQQKRTSKDAFAKKLLGKALEDLAASNNNPELKNLRPTIAKNFIKLMKDINPQTSEKVTFKARIPVVEATYTAKEQFSKELKNMLFQFVGSAANKIDKETANFIFNMINKGKGCEIMNLIRSGLAGKDKDWQHRYCKSISEYKRTQPYGFQKNASQFCDICNHICCNRV